jgi:ankyrin repeat protein
MLAPLCYLLNCQFLIEQGHQSASVAQVRAAAARADGKTPLHWAARNGHVSVIMCLVTEHGVPVDVPMKDGSTPLHMACFGGHVAAAACLVDLGADLCVLNDWRCGCAHFAAMGGHVPLGDWLWRRGITWDGVQKEGHTPFHKAAAKHNLNFLEFMASHGHAAVTVGQAMVGTVFASDAATEPPTCCTCASCRDQYERVTALVDTDGLTPQQVAAAFAFSDIVTWFHTMNQILAKTCDTV